MKPSIVVLDSFTTSPLAIGKSHPSHPSWDSLAQLGDLVLHHRTAPSQILDRIIDAPLVLTNKVVLDRDILRQLPHLRYIGLMSTGTNSADLEVASKLGITVSNVPAYSTASVAQHVIGLFLELGLHLSEHANLSRSGAWSKQPDFSITAGPIVEFAGKNFGIVGCGDIAQATARIAAAMGMRILVHSRSRKNTDFQCEWLDKEEFLSKADVISLHCPLTPKTENWIDEEALSHMKTGAFLINTSRGPVVDESAVATALLNGKLGGYGADVSAVEPPPEDHPLLQAPRSILTPHVAWASTEARDRLMKILVANAKAYLSGSPQNTV